MYVKLLTIIIESQLPWVRITQLICMGYKMIGHNSIKLTEFKLHGTYAYKPLKHIATQLIIVEIFMYWADMNIEGRRWAKARAWWSNEQATLGKWIFRLLGFWKSYITYFTILWYGNLGPRLHTWCWDPNNLLKLLVAYECGQSNLYPASGSNVIETWLVIITNFACPCLQLRVWESSGECGHELWSVEGGPALSWWVCEQAVLCTVYDPCECRYYAKNTFNSSKFTVV